jgi:hypothetical protein
MQIYPGCIFTVKIKGKLITDFAAKILQNLSGLLSADRFDIPAIHDPYP